MIFSVSRRVWGSGIRHGVGVLLAALLFCATAPAQALHVVSDATPDGQLNVAPGGRASLILDITARDFVQWTWSETAGRNGALSTQVVWTDTSGAEHQSAAIAAGQAFGNFDAPADLAGARIVWHNAGDVAAQVSWAYSASAAFWKRPEFFLPALLPLFLVGAAYYFGHRIDRRRRRPRAQPPAARRTRQQETFS